MEVMTMNSSLQVAGSTRSRSSVGHWLAILTTMAVLLGLLSSLGVGSAEAYAAETAPGAVRPLAQMMATTGHVPFPLVAANEAGEVRFSIAEFEDGVAHFYAFMANGLPVEFFVIRTSDNVIRTAFDACDVCYRAKLGYRQDGESMVCNNCGNRFPVTRIDLVNGGCNPAPFAARIDGADLVIAAKDLAAGLSYFP
jgi:hypothetical protein